MPFQSQLGTPFFSQPVDLGRVFNGAMESGQKVGADLGSAIGYVGDYAQRSSAADTVLKTMNNGKQISDDDYQSVMQGNLKAKEAIIGMHTTMALNQSAGSTQAATNVATAQAQGAAATGTAQATAAAEQQAKNKELQFQMEQMRKGFSPNKPTANSGQPRTAQPGIPVPNASGTFMTAHPKTGFPYTYKTHNGQADGEVVPGSLQPWSPPSF